MRKPVENRNITSNNAIGFKLCNSFKTCNISAYFWSLERTCIECCQSSSVEEKVPNEYSFNENGLEDCFLDVPIHVTSNALIAHWQRYGEHIQTDTWLVNGKTKHIRAVFLNIVGRNRPSHSIEVTNITFPLTITSNAQLRSIAKGCGLIISRNWWRFQDIYCVIVAQNVSADPDEIRIHFCHVSGELLIVVERLVVSTLEKGNLPPLDKSESIESVYF